MADPVSAGAINAAAGGEASTNFYEISGIALSLIQMILYFFLFMSYTERLKDLADDLGGDDNSLGNKEEEQYRKVRGWDDGADGFYAWYDRYFQATYRRCEVDVLRAKGAVYQGLGSVMRLARSVNRGYTPLAMLAHTSRNVSLPLVNVSYNRALGHFHEEARVDADSINRWNSRVSIPVFREGQSVDFSPIIGYLNSQVAMFGKGFNSAGVAFGNALYQYLRK